MTQNTSIETIPSPSLYNSANQSSLNNKNTEEKFSERNTNRKISKRMKSVSFNEKIEIYNIECWKQYNVDVSYETEYTKLKNKILKQKELLAKTMQYNECGCFVF